MGPLVLWSVVEANTGVISACLPTLRPIIETYRPRLYSKITGSSSTRSKNVSDSYVKVRLNSLEHKNLEQPVDRSNEGSSPACLTYGGQSSISSISRALPREHAIEIPYGVRNDQETGQAV